MKTPHTLGSFFFFFLAAGRPTSTVQMLYSLWWVGACVDFETPGRLGLEPSNLQSSALTNNMHIGFYYTHTPISSSKIDIFQNWAYSPLPHIRRKLWFDFDYNWSDIHCTSPAHPFPPRPFFQRGVVSKISKPFMFKNFIKTWSFAKPSIVTSTSCYVGSMIRVSWQSGWYWFLHLRSHIS